MSIDGSEAQRITDAAMTLLLGTIEPTQITLSADGMSVVTRRPGGRVHQGPGRMTLQKIFEVEGRSIAIAQYGTNRLTAPDNAKRSSMSLLREWTRHDVPGRVTEWADHLGEQFRRCPDAASLEGGIWVCGFDDNGQPPLFFELTASSEWSKVELLGTKFIRGDGRQFVRDAEWWDHEPTYRAALRLQTSEQSPCFGGHWHRLIVTPSRCAWNPPAVRGTLGLESLLDSPVQHVEVALTESTWTAIEGAWMDRLFLELQRRSSIRPGRRPGTLGGIEEHWRAESQPNWDRVHRLVDIFDEACLADASDISTADAALYMSHVEDIIRDLPAPAP